MQGCLRYLGFDHRELAGADLLSAEHVREGHLGRRFFEVLGAGPGRKGAAADRTFGWTATVAKQETANALPGDAAIVLEVFARPDEFAQSFFGRARNHVQHDGSDYP